MTGHAAFVIMFINALNTIIILNLIVICKFVFINNLVLILKSSVGSYIKLFEPLVIRALKQYTLTSLPEVQLHVLDLLTTLVQLRVNYCLLDSDQVIFLSSSS